jgi:O-antigen/teichoic acid export membrane protein
MSMDEGEVEALADMDAQTAVAVATPAAPTPPAGRSILFLAASLFGGNLLSMVLGRLGGFLQYYCTLHAVLGKFASFGLIQGYARFFQAGVLNGLNRELPYFYGKGDHTRVRELAAAAEAWALIVGGVTSCGVLAVAGFYLLRANYEMAAGFATTAVTLFLLFYANLYLQATYRTAHDFARLSLANVLQNTAAVVLVGLVALFGFYGLCLRSVFAALLGAAVLYYWRPIRVLPRWNLAHLRHLLWIGLPIFGIGEILTFWTTAEGTVALSKLGYAGMGLYSLAFQAGLAMEMLPQAISQVLYPRMSQEYGRTGEVAPLLRMSLMPMLTTFAIMLPLTVLGWLLTPPLVRLLLKDYVAAIPAMQWALLPPLLSSLAPIHNVYNVVRRQDIEVIGIVAGMAVWIGTLLWLLHGKPVLVAFPQALLVGRSVYLVALYFLLIPLVRLGGRKTATMAA